MKPIVDFVKIGLRTGAEGAFGDGKLEFPLEFPCFGDWESPFSLQVLTG